MSKFIGPLLYKFALPCQPGMEENITCHNLAWQPSGTRSVAIRYDEDDDDSEYQYQMAGTGETDWELEDD